MRKTPARKYLASVRLHVRFWPTYSDGLPLGREWKLDVFFGERRIETERRQTLQDCVSSW